jgi:hypothetical protein
MATSEVIIRPAFGCPTGNIHDAMPGRDESDQRRCNNGGVGWDARSWVASVLGVGRDDLMLISRDDMPIRRDDRAGLQVRYALVNDPRNEVARLVMAGPIRPLDGERGGHWEVHLEDAKGNFHSPPKAASETDDIDY